MNTQTLLNNVATGTIKVLQERSQDMGINWNKVGEFNNFDELIGLLVEAYPFEELDWDDVFDFINQEYLDVDDDDIDEIDIVDNAVYEHYRDVTMLEYCENLIYDKTTGNYLWGFSNSGWLRIDGAIDLETMTVGYFNSNNGEYRPVYELPDYDSQLIYNVMLSIGSELDTDCEYEVKRIDGLE